MREPCGLLQQRFGLHLPVRTVGEYLQRWGFTPQKPLTKAYEQNPRKVKAWLEAHRDAIAVHHLPSSSPELNPDERLNRSLKSKLSHLPAARDERSL